MIPRLYLPSLPSRWQQEKKRRTRGFLEFTNQKKCVHSVNLKQSHLLEDSHKRGKTKFEIQFWVLPPSLMLFAFGFPSQSEALLAVIFNLTLYIKRYRFLSSNICFNLLIICARAL